MPSGSIGAKEGENIGKKRFDSEMMIMMSASKYGEGAVVELLGHQHHKGKVNPPGGDQRPLGSTNQKPVCLATGRARSSSTIERSDWLRRWGGGGGQMVAGRADNASTVGLCFASIVRQ